MNLLSQTKKKQQMHGIKMVFYEKMMNKSELYFMTALVNSQSEN